MTMNPRKSGYPYQVGLNSPKEKLNKVAKALVTQINQGMDPLLLCMRPAGDATTVYAKNMPEGLKDITLRFKETIPMDPKDWEDFPEQGWNYGYDIVLKTEGYILQEKYYGINLIVLFYKSSDESCQFIYHVTIHASVVESNEGKQNRLIGQLCRFLTDSEDHIDLEPVVRQLRNNPSLREDYGFNMEDLEYIDNNPIDITFTNLVNGDWDY